LGVRSDAPSIREDFSCFLIHYQSLLFPSFVIEFDVNFIIAIRFSGGSILPGKEPISSRSS